MLQLSATNQRFYLSGGASITDITGVTDDEWASGDLTIDFRNDAGNASLFIAGSVNIGGEEGLTASLSGTVAADFSQLGSGDLEAFLKSVGLRPQLRADVPGAGRVRQPGERVVHACDGLAGHDRKRRSPTHSTRTRTRTCRASSPSSRP